MGNYIANSYTKMMDPIDRYNDPMDPYVNAKKNLHKYNLDKSQDYCLKFDRILDSENQIYIGIGCRKNAADKDKSLQVIRIGDYTYKYHRLLQFTESENKLKYEFESNIRLVVKKTENNDIHFELFDLDNDRFISKNIDPIIVKHSKTIGFQSKELDKIFELFADKIE
jgi:hypothetical protein